MQDHARPFIHRIYLYFKKLNYWLLDSPIKDYFENSNNLFSFEKSKQQTEYFVKILLKNLLNYWKPLDMTYI